MGFEVEIKTFKWLLTIKIITANDVKQLSSSTVQIKQPLASQFENGIKIGQVVMQIYKKRGLPIPATLNHLKPTNGTAVQLYNWNILNDSLKKVGFEIDSETKNLIINGDRVHLAMTLRKLHTLYESDDVEDSLETEQFQRKYQASNVNHSAMKDSLSLSKSEQPNKHQTFKSQALTHNIDDIRKYDGRQTMARGDLLEFIVNELTQNLKLSKKQAIALLSDNNKYLAHVLVKGVKGEFYQIQALLQRFYSEIDYIVEKMTEQNDMCFYFLQIIKPCLLSKSEEIAQWGCRILTKIAHELAIKQMLPLAYDWFVQEAGGLSTTILALSRHPKLNQHVVGYILQFARYNVTQLFTIQLTKITNNDNLSYVKFMLLIFNPLVSSKISSQQLLQTGAINYWIEITLKGAQNDQTNSIELRMYCIQFLIKIWRAYPVHIQDTLNYVNNIMDQIKRGIRDQSQIMRFTLMEMMFDLLNQFANKKNSYASIVYKKITFLFIENHEQLTMREFILRNLQQIFQKYQSIPVDIFLEPFIKQIKISESKSYVVNMFDMQFINVAVRHRKLKVNIGLQLFDLLAKTKLNSYSFSDFATNAMQILIDRYLQEDIFLEYTTKLVKISLAMFFSSLKNPKQYEDQERLQAQKRAEIVNFIISLIERANQELNDQIKTLVIHVKVQIFNRLGIQHRGIERILGLFTDVDQAVMEAMQNARDELSSNATSTKSRGDFHLPKIEPRNMLLRDETSSQQSLRSSGTKYSQSSKPEFPIKDYSDFATQDERNFLKQNGLGLKKKNMSRKKGYNTSSQKQAFDPKIQEQIQKIKLKKQQEQRKRQKQRQHIEKKKQMLKRKIQKQLQQRNVRQGVKGIQKDVEVKVVFEQNQINQNIMDEEDHHNNTKLESEEFRDQESIKVVLKRYAPFVKKIFNRYSNIRGTKKDYFDGEGANMNQVELLRLCKQKNIQKNKNSIIETLRQANNKNTNQLGIQAFFRFLEILCIDVYTKQKCATKIIMGDLMKKILRRMSQGQNFKLDEDDDEACQNWSEKVRYNPHIDLPENFKKIYQRVYKVNPNCSYPVKKSIKEKYIDCYQIVNDILMDTFKFNIIEEQVKFIEQARVMHKKQYYLPPKPLKKQKQKEEPISLLQEKETGQGIKPKKQMNRSVAKRDNMEKQNTHSRSKGKVMNAAEKKKIEEQQQKSNKKEIEEQLRKQRALEVKRKLQKHQEIVQKQKQQKQLDKSSQKNQEQQKQKKQKQRKQKYQKDQKQKIQKHKKEIDQKEKEEKIKNSAQRTKEQQQRKIKLKQQMKKEEEKRKDEYQKVKKQRQVSEQKKIKKKQQQEKKKQILKKQMMKKIQNQKQQLEINKMSKEVKHKIFTEPQIQQLTNGKYKEELKALFNYGKQYNQFKLDKPNSNLIQQKGWLNLCQQLGFCDTNTANKILKNQLKENNTNGLTLEHMSEILFEISVKKQLDNDLEDYDKAKKVCVEKYDEYLRNLKLPKSPQKLKDYFVNLKNQIAKKKQQMIVTNPNGQNETWEVQEK